MNNLPTHNDTTIYRPRASIFISIAMCDDKVPIRHTRDWAGFRQLLILCHEPHNNVIDRFYLFVIFTNGTNCVYHSLTV